MRVLEAGSRSRFASENVAWGPPTPAAAVTAWLASPPHAENLLDPRVHATGVAVARAPVGLLWVQDFAR